jgi:predicted TIM-barrel fold metal-dependent hydrolase
VNRGDLDIFDAHVHFFSHRFFSLLAAQKGCGLEEVEALLGWEFPDAEPGSLAARWVGELDRHGVTRAVLIASLPGDAESVAEAVRSFPERFVGFAMIDPTAEDAPTRVSGLLDAGFRGICLFPAMHRYSMSSEQAEAVVKAAASRPGTIIFVHCGVLSVGIRGKLGLPSAFDLRFSNPLDLHLLAQKYGSTRFIVPHFGAGMFREALMLCDLCPNVYLDTSSSNSWMRYLEGGWTLAKVFAKAAEVAGWDRLLFGTDSSFFPRGWQHGVFDSQVAALREAGASREKMAMVVGGNLRRLMVANPSSTQ